MYRPVLSVVLQGSFYKSQNSLKGTHRGMYGIKWGCAVSTLG